MPPPTGAAAQALLASLPPTAAVLLPQLQMACVTVKFAQICGDPLLGLRQVSSAEKLVDTADSV